MSSLTLLPDALRLHLDRIVPATDAVSLVVTAVQREAVCPVCSTPSISVHSRYARSLADLPWQGIAVRISLSVRRFFCRSPSCPRVVFAERLPAVAAPYARATSRLTELVRAVAFALGGEPGARLAKRLAVHVSPDTMLRRIRSTPTPDRPTPRQLGVDDFAFRRGQRYGTIFVDLETHQIVDVIDERTADVLAAWLRDHPGVEILSRDRAPAYAAGASEGAPDAIQVADRFHLIGNLREAVERVLNRHHLELREAAQAVADASVDALSSSTSEEKCAPNAEEVIAAASRRQDDSEPEIAPVSASRDRQDDARAARRQRRLRRYERIIELAAQGFGKRAIARQVGVSRQTVRRFLASDGFPERAKAKRRRGLDPFMPYLRERWAAGCHCAAELWREITALGYRGTSVNVRHAVAPWRDPAERCRGPRPRLDETRKRPGVDPPSPRQAAWLLIRNAEDVKEEDRPLRAKLLEICPRAATASALALDFIAMVNRRKVEEFDAWLTRAKTSGLRELASFAKGLEKDKEAVAMALSSAVSNGQVEGQVNKLKLLKRAMFGRAKLDLLRARLLHGP